MYACTDWCLAKWIIETLTPTLGLEIDSPYVKVEATPADIIVILRTLYERAEDIPAKPLTRLAFHAAVLEGGSGGFRPANLMDTKYRQYTLSVVRDPEDRTRTKIIVTPTIGRNKIKKTEMTCKYKKQKW